MIRTKRIAIKGRSYANRFDGRKYPGVPVYISSRRLKKSYRSLAESTRKAGETLKAMRKAIEPPEVE